MPKLPADIVLVTVPNKVMGVLIDWKPKGFIV